MGKGYMCFVDGQGTPQVVHPTYEQAIWQMKELAKKFPGQEVMVFHLEKRSVNKDGVHTPLPCHTPKDFKNPEQLRMDRLVFGKEKKPTQPA